MTVDEHLAALVRDAVREAVAPLEAEIARLAGQRPADDLTTEQAAVLLGVLPKTLRAWASEGRIKGTKRGRSWRFTRAQVEQARNPTSALADDMLRSMR